MKCLFVVLASLLLTSEVLAQEDLALMKKLVECGSEMGMNSDELKAAIDSKDSKVGCIVACALKKMGAMVNGKLDKNSVVNVMENDKEHIPHYDKMKENLSKCYEEATWSQPTGGNLPECELAGRFAACMHAEHM